MTDPTPPRTYVLTAGAHADREIVAVVHADTFDQADDHARQLTCDRSNAGVAVDMAVVAVEWSGDVVEIATVTNPARTWLAAQIQDPWGSAPLPLRKVAR